MPRLERTNFQTLLDLSPEDPRDGIPTLQLQELRQAPHRGRTLALLTSDNGAPSGGTVISGLNAPFVGTKFQTWEGGVRM